MKNQLFKLTTCLIAITALSGCARNINPNTYKASHVGESSLSYQGNIISIRDIEVKEGEYLEENKTGMALGGLTGGLVGTQIGGGRGQIAATVGGAILGATAGAFAEDALKTQKAKEYTVRLTNGSIMTVVQGPEINLSVGQPVLVIVGKQGRSRIIADNSMQGVQPMVSNNDTNINVNLGRR